MFSQKTTELLRQIRKYSSIGKKILVINYIHDTRYGHNAIFTHDKDSTTAICTDTLSSLQSIISSYDILVIDEGQFFRDIVPTVLQWVDTDHKDVFIASLLGDSDKQLFGNTYILLPHANTIQFLTAYCSICKDGTPAPFTKCIQTKEHQIQIGGSDAYMPVCRTHYTT